MQPTPKQAERLERIEIAVKQLDRLAEKDRFDVRDAQEAAHTTSDALESLRILVAQMIDAL